MSVKASLHTNIKKLLDGYKKLNCQMQSTYFFFTKIFWYFTVFHSIYDSLLSGQFDMWTFLPPIFQIPPNFTSDTLPTFLRHAPLEKLYNFFIRLPINSSAVLYIIFPKLPVLIFHVFFYAIMKYLYKFPESNSMLNTVKPQKKLRPAFHPNSIKQIKLKNEDIKNW